MCLHAQITYTVSTLGRHVTGIGISRLHTCTVVELQVCMRVHVPHFLFSCVCVQSSVQFHHIVVVSVLLIPLFSLSLLPVWPAVIKCVCLCMGGA